MTKQLKDIEGLVPIYLNVPSIMNKMNTFYSYLLTHDIGALCFSKS